MSTGAGSVLYNSIHSSVAKAEVPTQEISFMTTRPDILVVDKLGIGEGVGEGNSLGVGTGGFDGDIDGDGVGDSMVTLVTGVFVTNGVGDTDIFVTSDIDVTMVTSMFELSTVLLTPVQLGRILDFKGRLLSKCLIYENKETTKIRNQFKMQNQNHGAMQFTITLFLVQELSI